MLLAGSLIGGCSAQDNMVPWVEQPTARPSASLTATQDPRPIEAPCQPRDLESLWPEAGHTYVDGDSNAFAVLVRNVGEAACTLSGHVEVQGLDGEGRPIGAPAEPRGTGGTGPMPTIEPGEPARLRMSLPSHQCPGQMLTYAGAQLRLDNGLSLTIGNAWLQGTCRLQVGTWEPASPAAEPFWALEARMLAPSWADVGTELEYILELINVTRATVRLDRCPVFTQLLSPEATFDLKRPDGVQETHTLNCSQPEIGPKRILRFRMKIDIPPGFPVGRAVLLWRVEGGSRLATSTALNLA